MSDSMIKSGLILSLWVITAPSLFSIITSIIGSVYFGAMLKINVVNKYYDGSWLQFFKSIYEK